MTFPLVSNSRAVLDARSLALRRIAMGAMLAAGRGHPGSALSLVEILRVLYDDVMNVRPYDPGWEDRDRCILSKGHGCLALYAILADKGFFPVEELNGFCGYHSRFGGHPEIGMVPGVEASTGALGHGPSIAVGLALSARLKNKPWRVYVVTGDGESGEGSVWEAALCAGKYGLETLTVVIDYNKLQSYGPVEMVLPLDPMAAKWRAFGFGVTEVDGHDVPALREVLSRPVERGKPSAIICHTVKGRGIPEMENNPAWHHKSALSAAEAAMIAAALGGSCDA